MKEFLLSKLTVRVAGFVAVFLCTKIVHLLTSANIYNILQNIFVDPHLKPGAETYLRTMLELGITVGGATVYHFIHDKLILPHVKNQGENHEKVNADSVVPVSAVPGKS